MAFSLGAPGFAGQEDHSQNADDMHMKVHRPEERRGHAEIISTSYIVTRHVF